MPGQLADPAGGQIELVVYDGEGHGFRDPINVRDEYERTERFLAEHVPHHSDWELATFMVNGTGSMPSVPFEPHEGADVIAYLRATFGEN